VIPAGLLLSLQGQSDPDAVDAAARQRVELLAAGGRRIEQRPGHHQKLLRVRWESQPVAAG
jgi:hypothetical protein